MSLESVYGLRAIRDVAREIIREKGFRPRRVRHGFRLPRTKYLFSYYDETGFLIDLSYDRDSDTIIGTHNIRAQGIMQNTMMERDVLLSRLAYDVL